MLNKKKGAKLKYNMIKQCIKTKEELKTSVYPQTWMWVFMAALFLVDKTWKHRRCPSVGEWTNKPWYVQILEYFSALKQSGLTSHEQTGRKFKSTLPSERSQSEKAVICMIVNIWHSGKGKSMERVNRWVVGRSWGVEGQTGRAWRVFVAVKLLCITQ